MKNLRILFAILLCATVLQSCTTDDVLEEQEPILLKQDTDTIFAREGDETTTTIDTGDDQDEEPGDKD